MASPVRSQTPRTSVDPSVLGRRIRDARRTAGLTQSDLSGPGLSVAYLSRIEGGHRRPSLLVLALIADKLGTTVTDLVTAASSDPHSELRLDLARAEHEVESGQLHHACKHAVELATSARVAGYSDLADRAQVVHAQALVKMGLFDDARLLLEPRVADNVTRTAPLQVFTILADCYLTLRLVDLALQTAQRGAEIARSRGAQGFPESLELALTLAAVYSAKQQYSQAREVCSLALRESRRLEDHHQLSRALWQLSETEAVAGAVSSAIQHAEMAQVAREAARYSWNLERLGRLMAASTDSQ